MSSAANTTTILVVDDDAAVRQALRRVLSKDGYTVLEAADPIVALDLAQKHQPQLALVDLCLGESDGAELASRLKDRQAGLPLILLTGYPLRLHEDPELARPFQRVLTKPIDIHEFRRAVQAALRASGTNDRGALAPRVPSDSRSESATFFPNALSEGAMHEAKTTSPASVPETALPPSNGPLPAPVVRASATVHAPSHPIVESRGEKLRSTIVVALALVVLAGFVAYVTGIIPGMSPAEEPVARQEPRPRIELVPGQPHTVSIPSDVRVSLGIRKGDVDRLAVAVAPREARPLVLSGSTGLDPTHLYRFRVRFTPAECTEIGQVAEPGAGVSSQRELRSGDVVHKGQRLALFFSIDVGNKKNDLVDALVQQKLDQKIFNASKEAYNKGALPYLDYMAAVKAVEGDRNTITRAENTLRAWYIPEEDIQAVRKEAQAIIEQGEQRDRTPAVLKEQLQRWARVELRVPDEADGGTIVERNLSVRDVVVDNTLNLFQIAQVDRLMVYANAPEDELPRLQKLDTAQRRWTVRTAGAEDGIKAPIDDIGYIIDSAQHNAVVRGQIPNPGGRLRGGQYVTATIKLPPPDDVVEVPTSALADDGKQAMVFVEQKPGVYAMRRVEVMQRFDTSAFVRSHFRDGHDVQPLTPEEKEQGLMPRQALHAGDKVLLAGVLELRKELEDRESSR